MWCVWGGGVQRGVVCVGVECEGVWCGEVERGGEVCGVERWNVKWWWRSGV